VPDALRDARALVQQRQDALVEAVDPGTLLIDHAIRSALA
jgi:hypothetical protein